MRIEDLESLQWHQERVGLDSNETRGQIKAFGFVVEWMKAMAEDEQWLAGEKGGPGASP